MTILFALVGIGVIVAVAMLAVGRLGQLPDAPPDRAPLDVPEGPLEPDDIDAVRFAVGLRGYRMDEVDVVLDRLAGDLATRDARIAELERSAAGLPPVPVERAPQPQVVPSELPPPAPPVTASPLPARTDSSDLFRDPLDRRWSPDATTTPENDPTP